MSRIIQCFMNVNLIAGHEGLAELAKKHDINVKKLEPGNYLVFVNSARDRVKVFAANNVIAYLKLDRGERVNLEAIQEIPRAFNGAGRIDYDKALKEAIVKGLERRAKAKSALQVFRAAKAAGIA